MGVRSQAVLCGLALFHSFLLPARLAFDVAMLSQEGQNETGRRAPPSFSSPSPPPLCCNRLALAALFSTHLLNPQCLWVVSFATKRVRGGRRKWTVISGGKKSARGRK